VQNFLKIAPRVSELADPEIWHFPLTLLVVLTTLSHYRVRCDLVQLDLLGTTIMSHMSIYTSFIVQRLTPVKYDDALLSFALKVVLCRVALEEFHSSHGDLIKKYKF